MSKRYTRYVVTGNMRANDKSLNGVVVMDLGPCNSRGDVATKGSQIPKRQLTHRLFKFEDMKVAKQLGIPTSLATFVLDKQMVDRFVTEQGKETNERQ